MKRFKVMLTEKQVRGLMSVFQEAEDANSYQLEESGFDDSGYRSFLKMSEKLWRSISKQIRKQDYK